MKKNIFIIFICSLAMTGCSNHQQYKNDESNNNNYCISNTTSHAQYADCMKVRESDRKTEQVQEGNDTN